LSDFTRNASSNTTFPLAPLRFRVRLGGLAAVTALVGLTSAGCGDDAGATGTGGTASGGAASGGGLGTGGGQKSAGGGSAAGGSSTTGGQPGAGGGSGGGTTVGGTVLVDADFTDATPGTYAERAVEADFGFAPTWNNGLDEGRAAIVDEGADRFLRVTYPAGEYGPADGGVQFKLEFGQSYDELYFSYRVRFGAGFDFVKGGKLPGLVGGSSPTGCSPKDDGFSARNMWRTGGQAVQYVYYPDQPNSCGDDLDYKVGGVDQYFEPGTWHTVVHHVVMNDVGQDNGVFEAWLDGEQTLAETARVWVIASAPYDGINALYFSTFFGGGDASWAPSAAQTVDFDDLIVSTGVIKAN
jgi:hypothetical protein